MRVWRFPRFGRREDWFAWYPVTLNNGYNGADSPVVVWWEKVHRTKHGRFYLYTKWEKPNCTPGKYTRDRDVAQAFERRMAAFNSQVREAEDEKARSEIAANGT